MRTSDNTVDLLQALQAANLTNPTKDARAQIPTKSGGSFSYEYADLPTILATVRPMLQGQGVLLVQEAGQSDGHAAITTRLVHAATGQWLEVGPLVMPHGNDAQAVGSAITYGRRYQLLAALGLAAEDDDGARTTSWAQATAKQPATSGSGTEGSPPTTAGEAPAADAPGKGSAAGATTFDALRRMVGSSAEARELVNTANETEYTARSIVEATPAELNLAMATWQEAHP